MFVHTRGKRCFSYSGCKHTVGLCQGRWIVFQFSHVYRFFCTQYRRASNSLLFDSHNKRCVAYNKYRNSELNNCSHTNDVKFVQPRISSILFTQLI